MLLEEHLWDIHPWRDCLRVMPKYYMKKGRKDYMRKVVCSLQHGLARAVVVGGLLAALGETPEPLHAADLSVQYAVDATKLKKVKDGAVFNFKLYNDAACTNPPVRSQLVLVEDVAVLKELRLLKRIGASAPPKTARLEQVMTNVTPHPDLFLSVSGSGIVPVGGSCQRQLTPALGTSAVAGTLIMWSGALATIPTGWALCDGANGTPDLRDRFIRGASDGQAPGETGGATMHSHTISNHTHSFSDSTSSDASGSSVSPSFLGAEVASPHNHDHSVSGTTGNPGSPSTASVAHLPPFFKLAFLMKLP